MSLPDTPGCEADAASLVEIQLGHLCNNRCVFCVSGQRTEDGQAGVVPVEPLLARIRGARALGHDSITLLGGEPTLQPAFFQVLEECAKLGFREVVLFTNGVKTARPAMVDAILAACPQTTFRISVQGATRESHEATTRKVGSFARIEQTLANVAARGAPLTVNLCLVDTNYADLHAFGELVRRFPIRQLHIDLMRPLDAGRRSEDELRQRMPRFEAVVPALEQLAAAVPPTFDLNVGNLPFCVAPTLADVIHHDGRRTDTIAIDGDSEPSRPWDKYAIKRRDKVKPASCRDCLLQSSCSGVFEHYARFHGTHELRPLDEARVRAVDRVGGLVRALLPGVVALLRARGHAVDAVLDDAHTQHIDVRIGVSRASVVFTSRRRPTDLTKRSPWSRTPSIEIAGSHTGEAALEALVEVLGPALAYLELAAPIDASLAWKEPLVARVAATLRRAACSEGLDAFGSLRWSRSERDLEEARLVFDDAHGIARLELFVRGDRFGYRPLTEPDDTLRDALERIVAALRRTQPAATQRGARP